jgi:hypothetical protein
VFTLKNKVKRFKDGLLTSVVCTIISLKNIKKSWMIVGLNAIQKYSYIWANILGKHQVNVDHIIKRFFNKILVLQKNCY